jgi:hypothetical protein
VTLTLLKEQNVSLSDCAMTNETQQAFRITEQPATTTEVVSPETIAPALEGKQSKSGDTGLIVEAGIQHWFTPITEAAAKASVLTRAEAKKLHQRFGTRTLALASIIALALMLAFLLTMSFFSSKEPVAIAPSESTTASSGDDLSRFLLVPLKANANASDWFGRAQAAVALNESSEALTSLEKAVALDAATVRKTPFLDVALKSFEAGQPARSLKLLEGVEPTKLTVSVLQTATTQASPRIRRGAIDKLRALKIPVDDETGAFLLDALQSEKCEERRAAFSKVAQRLGSDERVSAAQQFLERKDSKCSLSQKPAVK